MPAEPSCVSGTQPCTQSLTGKGGTFCWALRAPGLTRGVGRDSWEKGTELRSRRSSGDAGMWTGQGPPRGSSYSPKGGCLSQLQSSAG